MKQKAECYVQVETDWLSILALNVRYAPCHAAKPAASLLTANVHSDNRGHGNRPTGAPYTTSVLESSSLNWPQLVQEAVFGLRQGPRSVSVKLAVTSATSNLKSHLKSERERTSEGKPEHIFSIFTEISE